MNSIGESIAVLDSLQRTKILSSIRNLPISAGATRYLPNTDGVCVTPYSKKTIAFLFTAAMSYEIEVSNDRVNWISVYSASEAKGCPWFEADCRYARFKVTNNTGADQTITLTDFLVRRF